MDDNPLLGIGGISETVLGPLDSYHHYNSFTPACNIQKFTMNLILFSSHHHGNRFFFPRY